MRQEDKTKFDSADSFVFRNERPWPSPRLKRAVIIGHTTATSSKIWVRTGEIGDYKIVVCSTNVEGFIKEIREKHIEVSEDDLSELIERFSCKAMDFSISDFSDDTTYVINLEGLEQGTLYKYIVLRGIGKENDKKWRVILGSDKVGNSRQSGSSFKTLSNECGKPFSFALFSCHNPFVEEGFFSFSDRVKVTHMEAWAAFAQTLRRHSKRDDKPLSFVIAGGDQVYTDGRDSISIWNYLYKVMRKDGDKLLPEEGTMLSWFRDIFRGYWGFPDVREVFSNYPTYMIWDDHEIGDGWGSFDKPGQGELLHPIYKKAEEGGLTKEDATALLNRMFSAAKEAYWEYEHCHNPDTNGGQFHYHFQHNGCAFFVLDGRGQRDISRANYRIHGEQQMEELGRFVGNLDSKDCKFLFVVSAVPLLHITQRIVGLEDNKILGAVGRGNRDDLRDGWEHSLHDEERREFKHILWEAAAKGIRVAILSGDVHASAAFRLEKDKVELPIYQLTSSAITYHLSLMEKFVAKRVLPSGEDGDTEDGEIFTRLALSVKSPYSIIQVDPESKTAVFQLYGVEENPSSESSGKTDLRTSSISRVELWKS